MNPAQVRSLTMRGAAIRETLGTLVRFRGKITRWQLAPISPDSELAAGGFRDTAEFSARILASQPCPGKGDQVVILSTNQRYSILTAQPADDSNPFHAEHIVTLVSA